MRDALKALPNVSDSALDVDVVVNGDGPWDIAFQGQYAGLQVDLTADGSIFKAFSRFWYAPFSLATFSVQESCTPKFLERIFVSG